METKTETVDIPESMKSLLWNRLLLKCVGIWPLEVSNPIFYFFFVYLTLHVSLGFSEMTNRKFEFNSFLAIFSEVLLIVMALSKMTMCWFNRQELGGLLVEIENNFIAERYDTSEKRFIFTKYTKMAKYYLLIAVTSMACSTVFYYMNELRLSVKMVIPNSSMSYKPPYKAETIVDIYDVRIYACLCIYQLFLLPPIILGYVGFDCLFANLSFHITAQYGVLSCMLKEILDDSNGFQRNMKELVLQHYKLIRQAKTLEDNFNKIILQQLMGTTFQLCASGYHTLLGSVSSSEPYTVIVFNFYATNTLATLFVYCYIGECLIQESSNLSNSFYCYEWYNESPINLKMVKICILRMMIPEQLTSGKFFVLSLASFTDILKTTMGYLSLLRTML